MAKTPRNIEEFLKHPDAPVDISDRYISILHEDQEGREPDNYNDRFILWRKAILAEWRHWIDNDWANPKADCGHEPTGWVSCADGDEYPSVEMAVNAAPSGRDLRFRRVFHGPYEVVTEIEVGE